LRDITATTALTAGLFLSAWGGSNQPIVAPAQAASLNVRTGAISIMQNPQTSSPAAGDDWNTFAHNVQRQSYETLPTGITPQNVSQLQLRWVYPAAGVKPTAGFNASPIVVNGVVYIMDTNGVVNAFNALTGKPVWAKPYVVPDTTIGKMTPTLYDGKLFVASYQQSDSDPNYYLAALSPQTGQQLWITKVPGPIHSSPVAINGVIYVGASAGDAPQCHAGGIYAFNENTGAPIGMPWLTDPNGGASGDGGGVWSSLTYDGKQLYYGSGNTCRNSPATANSIVALTPGNTVANWNLQTANALLDDDIGGSVLRVGHSALAVGKDGYFYHVNALTGQLIWKVYLGAADGNGAFATPSYFGSGTTGTLIVGGGYIHDPDVVSPAGGRLFGLTPAGVKRWEIDSNQPVLGSVALTPSLAFTPIDTNMDALDPTTGKVLWSSPTVGYSYSSPAIVPSGLFIADESGRLYAYGLPATPASRPALTPAQILQIRLRERPALYRRPKFCRTFRNFKSM